MISTDIQIWQRIQAGEQSALKEVFETQYLLLCRFAMQWTQDMDESEEIVQKMFVDIWERRAEIHIEITLRSYLFAAVRNRCLNFIKHRKVVSIHQRYVRDDSYPTQEISNLDEVNAALESAMHLLPAQCQRIFRMVKIDGKRYAEVASELDISVKTIENHMTKALRILKHELRDYLTTCMWLLFWLSNEGMN